MSNILQALESTGPLSIFLITTFTPALITFSIDYYNNLITSMPYKIVKEFFVQHCYNDVIPYLKIYNDFPKEKW